MRQEQNVRLFLAPQIIKYLPDQNKVFCSLIATSIKQGDYSGALKFFAWHCENGSSKI